MAVLVLAACGGSGGRGFDGGASSPFVALAPATYVGGFPISVATGHIDGDGHLDLVVAHAFFPRVDVLLGNGDGTFERIAPVSFGIAQQSERVALGFFNADPFLDLAVLDSAVGELHLFLGEGTGVFAPAPGSPMDFSATFPTRMVVSKLDDDVFDDLALTTGSGVFVLFCNGNGTFTPSLGSPLPFFVEELAAGDLDNDDDNDLLLIDRVGGLLYCLLGDGLGAFSTCTAYAISQPATASIVPLGALVNANDATGSTMSILGLTGVALELEIGPFALPHTAFEVRFVRSGFLTGIIVVTMADATECRFQVFELDPDTSAWVPRTVDPKTSFLGFGAQGDFVEGRNTDSVAYPAPLDGLIRVFGPR